MKIPKALLSAVLIGISLQNTSCGVKVNLIMPEAGAENESVKKENKEDEAVRFYCTACGRG